jgi:diketogulonate reductase-like aldo/keto reductase
MSLIDTAEMYGDGEADEITAESIIGQRQDILSFTKVYPHNSSRQELPKTCKRSRKRLRIDAITRNQIPMPESTAEYSLTNALSCG